MPVKRWNFCKVKSTYYAALTNKFLTTLFTKRGSGLSGLPRRHRLSKSKNLLHEVIETTTYRAGMQSVRTSTECSCDLLMETTLAVLPQACPTDSIENGGINGLKQFRVVMSVLPQLTPLRLNWLERGDMMMLIVSHIDSYLKKCRTSGGPQHQVQ